MIQTNGVKNIMKTDIRYLDLGEVSPEMYLGLWEYDNVIDIKKPTLIKWFVDRTLISFSQGPRWDEKLKKWGYDIVDLSDIYNTNELSDIYKVRLYEKLEIQYSADMSYYIEGPDVINYAIFCKGYDFEGRKQINEVLREVIKKIFKEEGIELQFLRINDLAFKDDGKLKKCISLSYRSSIPEYSNFTVTFTYKFDSEVANRVRNFKSKVRLKKFHVDDISNAVGGVWEINSTIDKMGVEFKYIDGICKNLNFIIKNDSLSDEEELKLFERGNRRLTEKEWYLYGNNENFEIRY